MREDVGVFVPQQIQPGAGRQKAEARLGEFQQVREPTIPGSTPSTPASEHDGASSAGGGSGMRHR